jgi:L-asparaginase II
MLNHLDIMAIFVTGHNRQSTYDLMKMMEGKIIASVIAEFGTLMYIYG